MVAALFYNLDIINESGLAPPPAEWPWEDFIKYAAKLRHMDGNEITRWGFHAYHPLNFVHSWGGALVDDWRNPTDTLIDSPASIAGYEAFASLASLELMPPSGWYTSLFLSETVPMVVSGLWGAYSFANANFQWDITLPPLGEGPGNGRGYEFVSRALGISTQTQYPEEAYRLLKFLAYDERAEDWPSPFFGRVRDLAAAFSVARRGLCGNDLGPKNKMLMLNVVNDVYRMPRHLGPSGFLAWLTKWAGVVFKESR